MTNRILTRLDLVRYVIGRVTITVVATGAITSAAVTEHLGTDLSATVPVGAVLTSSIVISIIVSALISAALSFRSAFLLRDLTRTRAELLRISCTDQLTGLLNRRGFDDEADSALISARQSGEQVVALMCDIDRFKSINDRFGHEFGDKVLVEIGNVLRQFSEASGVLIARHGGEEFSALMVGVTNEQAMLYAETLRRMCSIDICDENVCTPVTVSIGLTRPQLRADLPTIMRGADQALYQAKDRGRNRIVQLDELRDAIAA